ncbi:flagellar basal body P-ring biosynthesis protein FlgA [Psychromonas sp. CNPT3]|uniref:flagellar basal body P-ring formation chaperone FlgA n=1 Tax=Psychromonas sp. CNPT3 TaxID=314282 RepID=UPI00006E3496|nr:flagellar basal body P-ring formation chaperone FlgA [Psychromonas sp. CNPT3]AGH80563.1 flagellar basal body P-ring biosynthesis protein FlgA [Psychromonas sp. CNPT3]
MLIRFFILYISLGCSASFAETNYKKDIENFAETLILNEYNAIYPKNNEQKTSIIAVPLNKRITYKKCLSPFLGEIVSGKLKNNVSVKVTCPNKPQWSTYVRVRSHRLFRTIISAQALRKGETLNNNNIKVTYLTKSQLRGGSFSQKKILIGSRLKRNMGAQKIIKNRDVCFVCQKDQVIISAIKAGLVIKTSGIALNNANIGESVRVKNSRSQRIVVGTVSAQKEVQVTF